MPQSSSFGLSAVGDLAARGLRPLAIALGLPSADATTGACLWSKELVSNEYESLKVLAEISSTLSTRGLILLIYLLASFLNIYSFGFQFGVFWHLLPARRKDLFPLVVKAFGVAFAARVLTALVGGIVFGGVS